MRALPFALFAAWTAALPAFAGGWAGMCVKDTPRGVRVTCVCPDGPAEDVGVRIGDILESVEGQSVDSVHTLAAHIDAAQPGERIELRMRREGSPPQPFSLVLEERPETPENAGCAVGWPNLNVPDLMRHIHPHKVRAAYLGATVQEMTPELREYFGAPSDRGVLVAGVDEDSPAARGLEVGDVILEIEKIPVRCGSDLISAVREREAGESVSLRAQRRGRPLELSFRLEAREKTRFDLGMLLSGHGDCPAEKGGQCRFLWHWSEEDFETSLKRLEDMMQTERFQRMMSERAQRQRMLEEKLKALEEKLEALEKKARMPKAPAI
ncbi:MAG: PDZ domain-containing protein [Acidobacteriota bacterium]|nr:MAG: PDZ domain-containing protein [Acidobacteriota bacterium]